MPSSECHSPGLNLSELQQGHTLRNRSTRGSQFGQIMAAAFTWAPALFETADRLIGLFLSRSLVGNWIAASS